MLFVAACAALAVALPPGSVVVGTSSIDGTATDVVLLAPSGEREVLGSFAHSRGRLPKGTLAGDTLVTTSQVPDGTRSVVEITSADGARKIAGTGAIATQAPRLVDGAPLYVADVSPGAPAARFELRRGDRVLARFSGTWLTPASTRAPLFLAGDAGGVWGALALSCPPSGAACSLVERARFGKGRFRALAAAGDLLVVERDVDAGHAEVIGVRAGQGSNAERTVLWRGLPGMDPRACGDGLALGNGKKRAGVVVARVERGKLVDVRELDGGVAGVTTPLSCGVVDGATLVAAWLDKGASLPGELWLFSTNAPARRLLAPHAGDAVEVYGVVERGAP